MAAISPEAASAIVALTGPAVLLPIPMGEKGPKLKGWQRLSLADMTPAHLASLNHGNNIGVLLGAASQGLCSIDADTSAGLETLLEANPAFRESLQSQGARGGNIWLRITGAFPKSSKLTVADGSAFGEWRADGNQTVIHGTHPSGCQYRNNGKPPLSIAFADIVWPEGIRLPWMEAEKPTQKFAEVSTSPAGPSDLIIYPDNDAGHARRFCDRWKNEVAFIPERGDWLSFDGRWRKDINGGLTRRAIELAGEMMQQATALPCKTKDELHRMHEAITAAARWGDKKLISAMHSLAECFLEIQIPNDKVDAEPFLVGAENAVIDLRTGEGREYSRRDYITKTLGTHFDPLATCPRWVQFMGEIFPDADVRRYVWKAIGYSLTGDMREKCFFFLHGLGDNGKSVFLELMEFILGNYADQGGKGLTVTNSQGSYPTREAAKIVGKRLVLASETEEREKMNTGVIKSITGGDSLDAAGVYEKHFTFKPTCKIWFAGNYKPTIHDAGPAIWGRVRLIPFDRTFVGEEIDLGLRERLKNEAPGILNWLIQGCLLWQAEGLAAPSRIVNEVESYRKDEDTLAEFIEDCTEPELMGEGIQHADLFTKYREWAIGAGLKFILDRKRLAKSMRERGWSDIRTRKAKIHWQGYVLQS